MASMRVWVVPELDGHSSMPIGRQAQGHPTGCLSASLNPIEMVHTQADLQVQLTQVQLILEQTSVRWSPYVCLSPCLPALPTHLAPLRFLQAEAASVDLALRLRVDLDELIALGVPAGLGGLWRALPSVREGLSSGQKADTALHPLILRFLGISSSSPTSSTLCPCAVPPPPLPLLCRGRATHPSR